VSAQKNLAAKIRSRPQDRIDARLDKIDARLDKTPLGDEARFIRSWLENPRLAGAITPSGRFLARAMAHCIDPSGDGPIVELGPGTGPVTQALLERGIAPERLVLVEFEPSFCNLLARKFPGVKVVRGDAYHLTQTLGELPLKPAAIVSSLPLLTKPEVARIALMRQAFELMGPDGRFIQFTYGAKSPIPTHLNESLHIRTQSLSPIWLNLPPARIFIYRHAECLERIEPPPDMMGKLLRQSRRFGAEIRGELEEARARLVANNPKVKLAKSRPR
jgi:phosphatidylethanolamine/phosphatidyl-N-methylethanolamine N-methyltransferase